MKRANLVLFLSSPGDMVEEREIVVKEVRKLNTSAKKVGLPIITMIRWPEDIAAGAGNYLQSVINHQANIYDIFVGLVGSRLGTATPVANSGTEEEFDRAIEALRRGERVDILLFFSNRLKPLGEIDPHQLMLVHYFRQKTQRLGVLAHSYSDIKQFRQLLRKSLETAYSKICTTGAVSPAKTNYQVGSNLTSENIEIGDIHLKTQLINPQWAHYFPLPLFAQKSSVVTIRGQLRTESPYFRFGFKYGDAREPIFSTGSIQNPGQNIVVHVGKNLNYDKWFLTFYQSGIRRGKNISLPNLDVSNPVSFVFEVVRSGQIELKLNDTKYFDTFFSLEGIPRLLLMAWGDEHEFQCDVNNINMTVSY